MTTSATCGCGRKVYLVHCEAKGCGWFVCTICRIAFDPTRLGRQTPWLGGKK